MTLPFQRRAWRSVLISVLLVEVLVVGWLVLNPSPATSYGAVETISDLLESWGVPQPIADTGLIEFVLNVAMFVPPGATLAVLLPRVAWWQLSLVGLAGSVGIEVLQLLLPDRTASLSDVVANTVGLAAGALMVAVAMPSAAPQTKRAETTWTT